jgi:histidyl-tRNA synthetase
MGHHVLSNLGLSSAAKLEINTLGDDQSRLRYRDVLREFFQSHLSRLSPLSRDRLERGSVLRILDSKEKEDKELIQMAPVNSDHLTPQSKDRFQSILASLDQLNIPYAVNPRLVRGLDYYSETCFEWVSNSSGSAILAGGRYDALVKQMGGPDIPGIGCVLPSCNSSNS